MPYGDPGAKSILVRHGRDFELKSEIESLRTGQ